MKKETFFWTFISVIVCLDLLFTIGIFSLNYFKGNQVDSKVLSQVKSKSTYEAIDFESFLESRGYHVTRRGTDNNHEYIDFRDKAGKSGWIIEIEPGVSKVTINEEVYITDRNSEHFLYDTHSDLCLSREQVSQLTLRNI